MSSVIFPTKSSLSESSSSSLLHGVRIARLCPRRCPSLRVASYSPPSSSVVMMSKREEELKEIRTKSTEELNEEIVDLKGELFMLRLQRSAKNEFKSSEFRLIRKRVFSLFFNF
ncbi:50S ribosomal protein l29 chloroplastic [Phtheirospermum japonicum]|uniref:Large ribosomal subunit protein uL29c n=1 Tax=Phtheirospermum japonicum TaxID=374723 RepID=A0A830C3E1_9LAMI|nr:50S ribosomal protein l29 chloroplastic [Phtheirospermum japonicum]